MPIDWSQLPSERESTLKRNYRTYRDDPERAAKVVDIAGRSGLPEGVVERNTDEAEQRANEPDWEKLQAESPGLSDFLSEPQNFKLAKDDTDSLSMIEKHFGALAKSITTRNPTYLARSVGAEAIEGTPLVGLAESLSRTPETFTQALLLDPVTELTDFRSRPRPTTGGVSDVGYTDPVTGEFREQAIRPYQRYVEAPPSIEKSINKISRGITEQLRLQAEQSFKELPEEIQQARREPGVNIQKVYDIGGQIPAYIGALLVPGRAMQKGTSMLTRLSTAERAMVSGGLSNAAIIGSQTYSSAYQTAYETLIAGGMHPQEAEYKAAERARNAASQVRAIAAVTGGIGEGPALAATRLRQVPSVAARGAAAEVPEELTQSAAEKAAGGQSLTLEEMAEIAALSAMFGAGVSGGMGTLSAVTTPVDQVEGQETERIFRSEQEQARIDDIQAATESSRLYQRAPQTFKEFVKNVSRGTDNVYINPANLEEDAQAQLRALTGEQVDEALETGGDVLIPTADFIGIDQELYNQIRPHIRLSPDSLTQDELSQAQEGLQQRVDQLLEEAQQTAEIKSEADAIFEDVRAQLVETGRISDRNARFTAQIIPAYVTTQAARTGKSVQEIYKTMGIQIRGPGQQVEERRKDRGKREVIENLPPEDQEIMLKSDVIPALRGKRAFEIHMENNPDDRVMFYDADDFKVINDLLGEEETDRAILGPVGEIIEQVAREHGVTAFHRSGDEFLATAGSDADLEAFAQALRERAESAKLRAILPDGSEQVIKGIGFSYGIGEGEKTARALSKEQKAERKAAGLRTGSRDTAPVDEAAPAGDQVPAGDVGQQQLSQEKPQTTPSSEGVSGSGRATIPPMAGDQRGGRSTSQPQPQERPEAVPKEKGVDPKSATRVYRAHTDDDVSAVRPFSAWTTEEETAQAYTDNQGFGGPNIRSVDVDLSDVLDVADIQGMRGKERLAEALGYENPQETAQDWQDSGYLYPWEESSEVKKRLQNSEFKWLRYEDDSPAGADTVVPLKEINLDPESSPRPQRAGQTETPALPVDETASAGDQVPAGNVGQQQLFQGKPQTTPSSEGVSGSDAKTLAATHNLSADNLVFADRVGGLAVPSIGIVNTDVDVMSGFGEITLISDKKLIDPRESKTSKVFDADVYSPRYPKVTFKPNGEVLNTIRDDVSDAAEKIGKSAYSMDSSEIEDRGLGALYDWDVLQYKYLADKGKAPKTVYRKKKKLPDALKKFKGQSSSDLTDSKEFENAVADILKDDIEDTVNAVTEDGSTDEEINGIRDAVRNSYFDEDGDVEFRVLNNYANAAEKAGGPREIDSHAMSSKVRRAIDKDRDGYRKWVYENYGDIIEGERIFNGFTYSGKKKWLPHDMDTVVRILKKELRDGEGFNYGPGSIRSTVAKQFRSIKQIKESKDKLVSDKEFQKIRDEVSDEFLELADKFRSKYKYSGNDFGFLDRFSEVIKEGAKRGRLYDEIKSDFNADESDVQEVADFLDKLKNMPTEYFEAKVQRAVSLDEFSAAVVPRGTPKEAINVLESNGINIQYYNKNDPDSRRKAVQTASKKSGVLFSREEGQDAKGSIEFLDQGAVVRMFEASDLSTFLHESGHLFLQMESRFADPENATEDQSKILEFLGVESFDQIQTEHHEKFARAFEAYLFEGKAPSAGLREAFAKFRDWLLNIYKSIRNLDVELSDEIRGVFDRMLATDEQIAAAAANPSYDQLFRSKEQAGMTDAEWRDYQNRIEKARNKSESTLDEKLLKEWRQRKTQEWRAEKAPLIEEEKARLSDEPLYRAISDMTANPVNSQEVMEILGVKRIPGKFLGRNPKVKKGGASVETLAEIHGYKSPRDLLESIIQAPTLNQAAEESAEVRMIRRHGDILNDGTIEEEVREALQNEERAQILLTEVRALNRKQSRPPVDKQYLKDRAKDMIRAMKWSEIQPHRYYRNMIRAAENAGKAENEADQLTFKTQQLANHYLYREAQSARDEIEKYRKYIRGVEKRDYQPTQVSPEYIQNMKVLSRMYDMRKSPKRIEELDKFLNWYLTQLEDPNQFIKIELLDENLLMALEAKRRGELAKYNFPSYKDLTVEQLRGLHDQLKHLRYVGGQMADLEGAEFKVERDRGVNSINDNGGNDVANQAEPGRFDAWIESGKEFMFGVIHLRNLTRKLDGWQDTGWAYDNIFKLSEESSNNFLDLQKQMAEQYREEFDDLHNITVDKVNKITKRKEQGGQWTLSSEGRVMLALYWGTESSREAIMLGHGVTEADVMNMLSEMSEQELQLVNKIWKLNESLWPGMSQLATRMYGVTPAKVEATPFTVNGVEMTGGHMRLYYADTPAELEIDEEKLSATAPLSFTKPGTLNERVGSGGKKVLLDKSNIVRSMNENIHAIAYGENFKKVARFVNNRDIKEAIIRKHGKPFYNNLVTTVQSDMGYKRDREHQRWLAMFSRQIRHAATFKTLGFSIRNTVQQFSAVPIAMDEVGSQAWTYEFMNFLGSPNTYADMVREKSSFMRHRGATVNREAAEHLEKIGATSNWAKFKELAFFLQTQIDSLNAYPTWMAKYKQVMEEASKEAELSGEALQNAEQRAISAADTSVSESIGSGLDRHLGQLFSSKRTEFVRMVTIFGSWFNAYTNRIYRDYNRGDSRVDLQLAKTMVTTPLIVGMLSAALIHDFPDDDESWFVWGLQQYGLFMAGLLPLFRDIVGAYRGFAPKTPAGSAAEAVTRFPQEIEAYLEGRQSGIKTASDIGRAVTTIIPVPGYSQVARMIDYWDSYEQGNEESFDIYQMMTEGKTR